jgi:hypothetical protein
MIYGLWPMTGATLDLSHADTCEQQLQQAAGCSAGQHETIRRQAVANAGLTYERMGILASPMYRPKITSSAQESDQGC